MKIFSEIDENFKFDYKSEKIKNFKIFSLISLFATSLSACDCFSFYLSGVEIHKLDLIYLFWSYYAQVIFITSVYVLIRGIFERSKKLRENLLKNKNGCKNYILQNSPKTHLKIIKLISKFNEIFSLPIFLYFSNFFCWICVLIFDVSTHNSKNCREFIGMMMMNIPHTIYMFAAIIILVKSIENIKEEIQKCLTEIFEHSNESENFLRFSTQIVQLPIKFSCGLIDFDWKMVFKVRKK
jgi:hypothetical protein